MSRNDIPHATQEALDEGYGSTKYGVLEARGEDYSEEANKLAALQRKDASVVCPLCQEPLCPAERFGGLLVCPKHGTAPFETTR